MHMKDDSVIMGVGETVITAINISSSQSSTTGKRPESLQIFTSASTQVRASPFQGDQRDQIKEVDMTFHTPIPEK